MSTVVEETQRVEEAQGVPSNGVSTHVRPLPTFPFVAAPFAAVSAAIVAGRIARRRQAQAAKPSVYWSFSFASGNRVYFRPTLAPRFASFLVRGRPRTRAAGRRLFKR